MRYYPPNLHKYTDILALFNDTANLELCCEDTDREKIKHKPTGWYFYTDKGGAIICFFHERYNSVDCPILYYIYTDIFTKPAIAIQKAVYEAKTTK